jgi:hypothetical protein
VSSGPEAPRLVALDGPMARVSWTIPIGQSTIGRDAATGIVVEDDSVSRRHASVARDDDRVVLNDLGSTNGTWINGRRLYGKQELRAGDTVRLGHVSLAFVVESGARTYGFGDVHGAVHAGEGDQYLNGRDHYDQRIYHHSNDYDGWDEAFQGKGFGRFLTIAGGVLALAGFGLVLYFFYVVFGSDINDPAGQSPFAVELVPGVPVIAVGFGAFAAGGIIAGIGSGMSKAARKRAERRQADSKRGGRDG